MKILFDHQIFSWQKYGGISRYFVEMMKRFQINDTIQFDISLYLTDNKYLKETNLDKKGISIPDFPGKEMFYRYTNRVSSQIHLMKEQFDIFHPTYFDPYFLSYLKGKPFVLTIYDMCHEVHPSIFSPKDPLSRNKRTLAEEADKIITISQNTKNDIIRYFHIDKAKIDVIYLGNSLKVTKMPEWLHLPTRYILFVGDRHLYKNFSFFVTAIAPLLTRTDSLYLLCAGGKKFLPDEEKLFGELSIRGKVLWYPVSDALLFHFYRNAICFVYPSLYEGFGIPILESFFSGCPVVLSNTSSFPEVAGKAAFFFDPLDEKSILKSVSDVVGNVQLQESLRQEGYHQGKKYSWDLTAKKTIHTYRELLEN